MLYCDYFGEPLAIDDKVAYCYSHEHFGTAELSTGTITEFLHHNRVVFYDPNRRKECTFICFQVIKHLKGN